MTDKIIELTFPTTQWHSVGDENSFFQWLYSISGYLSSEKLPKTLHVQLDPKQVDVKSLVELVALFERYPESDIRQLRRFANGKWGSWFSSPNRYWRKKIFYD